MTDLAKLVVSLEAQTASYERKLNAANSKLDRFARQSRTALNSIKTAFLSLGVAVGGIAFGNMIREQLKTADAAAKFSAQVGVSVETLTGLKLGVMLAGVSVETFNKGLLRLARSASDAGSGLATQKRAFDDLGVSVIGSDGKLRSVESILRDVSDSFSKMENGTRKAARAAEIFGRAGAELIPFLNDGSKGIDEILERSKKLNLVWSTESTQAAEHFNDNLTLLAASGSGFASNLVQTILPTMNDLTDWLVKLAEEGEAGKKSMEALKGVFTPLSNGVAVLADGFETLGKRIAATAAVITLFARGDFGLIPGVIDDFTEDVEARFDALAARLKKQKEELNKELAAPIAPTFVKDAVGAEAESSAAASKRIKILSDMADFNDQLVEQTRNRIQAQRDLEREILAPEVMTTRDSADDFDNVVFGRFDKMKEQAQEFEDLFTQNLVQAAEGGFDQILKSWTRTLLQMAARAVSSKIFSLLSQGKSGGIIGAIGAAFGGAKEHGGPVAGGTPYLVGERGPELFVPRSSGSIVPNGGGGVTNITVNAPNSMPGMEVRIRAAVQEAVQLSRSDRADSRRRGR